MRLRSLLNSLLGLLLFCQVLPVKSYYFATDVETKILKLSENSIELKVTRLDDEDETEVYPVGTRLRGKIIEHKGRRRMMHDEFIKFKLTQAKLPEGKVLDIEPRIIKLKPRVFFNTERLGAGIVGATALTLKLTVALWSVGFPVGRGGKALWDSTMAVYNTPKKESRWKQGGKGFLKGLLFPIPELFMKGEALPVHEESYIWIQDAKEHKEQLSAFIVKRKNIYLDREKYYEEIGKKSPNFQHLMDKWQNW